MNVLFVENANRIKVSAATSTTRATGDDDGAVKIRKWKIMHFGLFQCRIACLWK